MVRFLGDARLSFDELSETEKATESPVPSTSCSVEAEEAAVRAKRSGGASAVKRGAEKPRVEDVEDGRFTAPGWAAGCMKSGWEAAKRVTWQEG